MKNKTKTHEITKEETLTKKENPRRKPEPGRTTEHSSEQATVRPWNMSFRDWNTFAQNSPGKTRVRAALRVSSPADPAEREADRISQQAVSMKEADISAEQTADVQASPASGGIGVSTAVESGINSLSGGQQLSNTELSFFGPRLGADFSGVRVHNTDQAHSLADSINARAFTRGSDIVFAKGEYAPGTGEGKKLLAHELVHVVQGGKGKLSDNMTQVKLKKNNSDQKENLYQDFILMRENMTNYIFNLWIWERENYLDFFDRTFPYPMLATDDSFIDDMLQETIGNLSAEIITLIGKTYLKTVAPALAKLFFGLPGFLISIFIETITGKFLGNNTALVDKAASAKQEIRLKIDQKFENLRVYYSNMTMEYFNDIRTLQKNNNVGIIKNNIQKMNKFFKNNLVDTTNRDLYYKMLKVWILENAESDDEARHGVSNSKWKQSVKELQKKGELTKGDFLENQSDLFMYQTRLFLSKIIGIPSEPGVKNFIGKVNYAKELIAQEKFDSIRRSNNYSSSYGAKEIESEALYKTFDKYKFWFKSAETKKLLRVWEDMGDSSQEYKYTLQKIRKNKTKNMDKLLFTITLDLKKSGYAVYVDEWKLKLELADMFEDAMERTESPSTIYNFY